MGKIMDAKNAVKEIKDGMTLMVGGFMTVGTPEYLIESLIEKGIKDLTIICNDAGYPNKGVGRLISQGRVKKLIASHIGLNPDVGRLMNEGAIEVVLTPQGTLVEQIRAGGAGLGGVLTPTGIGTLVEKGKEVIDIDKRKYILEKPLKADFSLILASECDEKGNVIYNYTTRNFNPVMATAGEKVVVESKKVLEVGEIHVDRVMTPSIFIDYIVKSVREG